MKSFLIFTAMLLSIRGASAQMKYEIMMPKSEFEKTRQLYIVSTE